MDLTGINRYIMECKLERELRNRGNKNELIDTLWNVNETAIPSRNDAYSGINRYIMECK